VQPFLAGNFSLASLSFPVYHSIIMEPYRVAIIDDHELLRQGFASILGSQWQIVGEAAGLEEARMMFENLAEKPHLVVLDFALAGDDSALDILRWLDGYYRARNPPESPPPALVYSAFSGYAHVSAALGMGALGYISKAEPLPVLRDAMLRVAQGETVIGSDAAHSRRETVPPIESLTAREKEILLCVQKGWNDAHIRQKFNISQRTVETYLYRIYAKLGFTNRKELLSLRIMGGGGVQFTRKNSP
jgi:DNA-binding NarL/FixJ family response regulator